MPSLRYRLFVFTDFRVVDAPERYTQLHDAKKIRYIAYGEETCPSTGRPHNQGWCYTNDKMTLKQLSRLLLGAHVEGMLGSLDQCDKYCSKQGELRSVGERPRPGRRTDLETLAAEVKQGRKIKDIILNDPQAYHQFGRTLEKIADVAQPSTRSSMTEGLWLWGPTGSGKSRRAFADFSPDTHYVVPLEDKGWWDLYEGQATVILDDFRGSLSYATLLRMVDRYPFSVPRRGRIPAPFVSTLVIVTSSLPPEQVFHNLAEKDSLDQLYRRFKVEELK